MKISRRQRRAQERASQKNFNVLAELLMGFYEFLERTPQPSDEEVREEFLTRERCWKRHCSNKQLSKQASLLFNQEVAQSWQRRYAKKNDSIEN